LKKDIEGLQQFVSGQSLQKDVANSLRRLIEPNQDGEELSVANVIRKQTDFNPLTDLVNSVLGDKDIESRRQDAKRVMELLSPLQCDAGCQFAAWLLR
jgi:hypothetical protein